MRANLFAVCTALCAFACGCGEETRHQESGVPPEIQERIDECVRIVLKGIVANAEFRGYYGETGYKIRLLTNDVMRVACIKKLVYRILEIDLALLDVQKQGEVFVNINDVVWPGLVGTRCCDPTGELSVELRIAFLEWTKRHHKRLYQEFVDNHRRIPGETFEQKMAWQRCFRSICLGVKYRKESYELRFFMLDHDRQDPEQVAKLRKKVEDYLGHPMRSREQIAAERGSYPEGYWEVMRAPCGWNGQQGVR